MKELMDKLERKYGKGPTYGLTQQRLILNRVVPEWVLRGELLLSGPLRKRCQKAREALTELHGKVWPQVKD